MASTASAFTPSSRTSASIMAMAGWVEPQQGNCLRPFSADSISQGEPQFSNMRSGQ